MESWADERGRAIAHHAAEQERRRAVEAEQAMALVAEFVAAARTRGLPDQPLKARSYTGRTYRTRLRGWYVHPAKSFAVGTDGNWYSLLVPPGLAARFTGASVEPARPKLVIGEGARDGESIPLATLLTRALEARPPG